ncbi:hypothetical protein ACEQ8H_007420 [Pleosporales sp. CAS-2024a]
MSHEAHPITLTRFASALNELPIDAIYSKYSELRNNISHMESSNVQLEEFARENDDRDCYEALLENRQVMKRFEERIEALKREVTEVRGLPWRVKEEEEKKGGVNDDARGALVNGTVPTTNGATVAAPELGNGTAAGGDDDGVFL